MDILTNSVGPDEKPHNVASYLGPHCLLKIQTLFADSNSMLLLFYLILTCHHLKHILDYPAFTVLSSWKVSILKQG